MSERVSVVYGTTVAYPVFVRAVDYLNQKQLDDLAAALYWGTYPYRSERPLP